MDIVQSIFSEKYSDSAIYGDSSVSKPNMIPFRNVIEAIELLHYHIVKRSDVIVHCDVDMDGIGCGYIIKRFVQYISDKEYDYVINIEKEHGISDKHVPYFNSKSIGLLIVVDSSSNELEAIKGLNCDVLVIDHHEVGHNELIGRTNDGHKYVIVNNLISNLNVININNWLSSNNVNIRLDAYEADSRMSCGLVVYEILRILSLHLI